MQFGFQHILDPLIYSNSVATMYTAFGNNHITLFNIMLYAFIERQQAPLVDIYVIERTFTE
jgi:hypothetical protein